MSRRRVSSVDAASNAHQDVDQKLAAEGTKLNFADRGKYLSERWKVLPAEEKQRYTVRLVRQL